MARLSDEILMAYADGALDPKRRARVEEVLAVDPECRRRVEAFRTTGASLAPLFQQPMREPIPAHLVDFVLNYNPQPRPARTKDRARGEKQSWLVALLPQGPAVRLAFACAAALILGLGAGWMLFGGWTEGGADGPALVAFKEGQIVARGALHEVLETATSGKEVALAEGEGALTLRANLTFRDKARQFCREYQIISPRDGSFAGVGCRNSDGRWAVQLNIATATIKPKGSSAAPAAAPKEKSLEALIEHVMDGDALGKAEEAAAIENGWRD